MKKAFIVIIIVIIAVLGFFFFSSEEDVVDETTIKTESTVTDKSLETDAVESSTDEIEDVSLENNPNAEVANLVAVDGSNSSGTGYRLEDNNMLYHKVIADMPDPAGGNKYEGWLVQTSPLDFFSTGVMTKNSDGKWVLEYSSDQEYPSHLRVVITEETVVDATPEEHIIEGDF